MSLRTTELRVSAPLVEVFASIQGEGLYIGEPQTFVRLRGCPLRCRYCDTPASWELPTEAPPARVRAVRDPRRESAWATPFQVARWIAEVEPGAPRTLSVTGGEPLLWPDFIVMLRSFVRPRRVHLETAGAHPQALARVLEAVDHVSLDVKLASDLDEPVELEAAATERAPRTRAEWAEVRAECLKLVRERDACAKVIVTAGRDPRAFDELFESVAEHAPELVVIVQPATAIGAVAAPSLAEVERVAERALALDLRARILPQLHRSLGIP